MKLRRCRRNWREKSPRRKERGKKKLNAKSEELEVPTGLYERGCPPNPGALQHLHIVRSTSDISPQDALRRVRMCVLLGMRLDPSELRIFREIYAKTGDAVLN